MKNNAQKPSHLYLIQGYRNEARQHGAKKPIKMKSYPLFFSSRQGALVKHAIFNSHCWIPQPEKGFKI